MKKIIKIIILIVVVIFLIIILRDIYILKIKNKNECCSCCEPDAEICIDLCCPCTKTIIIPRGLI